MTELFDSRHLASLRRRLRGWYRKHGRLLPWRETGDAYRIWVSEVMLQQTTVAAVKPFFDRFLSAFPTVFDLAAAEEAEVLRLWEGLGYYSRARNLHSTARKIVERHSGKFPQSATELQSLPGIGRYTAGAICSFAFDRPEPIVEANTQRLYARLLGFDGDVKSTAGQKTLWEFAGQLIPRTKPGEFNQALMDLGSQVCTPKEPNCPECPLLTCCEAAAQGRTHEIPRPTTKVDFTEITDALVAVSNGPRILLRIRGSSERWAGMWDFPRIEVPESFELRSAPTEIPGEAATHVENECRRRFGLQVALGKCTFELKHTVTRYRIRLLCLLADFVAAEDLENETHQWFLPEEFANLPLPSASRRFANFLVANPAQQQTLAFD